MSLRSAPQLPALDIRHAAPVSAVPAPLSPQPWVAYHPVRAYPDAPKLLIQVTFFAFIFSLPFETADIGIGYGSLSLSKVIGYLFLLSTLLQPRICYQRFPSACGWF